MKPNTKEHLKDLLVARGFAASVEEAERMVLAGQVKLAGEVALHAGSLVASDVAIEVQAGKRYVSRGGLKLEGALADFGFDPQGLRCIDVGTSTGGFTDCLLQKGAQQLVSVDVGYGQFDWKLRTDERVHLFERTNIAKVSPEELGAPFDLVVADVSFTSLARLAPVFSALVSQEGSVITLVKPQFELPRAAVKNGVVRSFDLHVQALDLVEEAFKKQGLYTQAVGFSPVLGPKGNIEFWIWAVKQKVTATIENEQIVQRAHAALLDVR